MRYLSKRDRKARDASVTDGFIHRYLEGIDTPRSLAVWLLYSHGEHDQLVDLDHRFDCEPVYGLRSDRDCALDYIATEFLSKAKFLTLGVNPKQEAINKFKRSEVSCRSANRRLSLISSTEELPLAGLISSARVKIAEILGKFKPLEFIEKVNWGPGATARLSSSERLSYDKFRLEGGMSADCFDFWTTPMWELAFPRWSPTRVVETAYLHTVAKNSKTDRTIMIEPGINTFLQKGLGRMIRNRLARIGLNLRTQADFHESLVPLISRSGDLATVDFSAASDSISRMLVELLLPRDWFLVLSAHRSGTVEMPDGTISVLEKFSSMGNGFTFELQTLIFYSLAHSVCERGSFISVFGDDVILPSKHLDAFRDLCTYAGLTLNSRKSFSSGYFRESCGAHSFNGRDAKPLYLRGRLRTPHDIFKTANQTRRLAHRSRGNHGCDARYARAWGYLTGASTGRKYDVTFRDFYIPDGAGDFGLCVDFDVAQPHVQYDSDYQAGHRVRLLVPRYQGSRNVDDYPLLLSRLFQLGNDWDVDLVYDDDIRTVAYLESVDDGNRLPDLGSPIRFFRKEGVYVPFWRDLGAFVYT